jgi:C4-type Zn-finger protein
MKTKMKSLLVIIVMLISTSSFAQQGNRKSLSTEERVSNVITKIEKKIEITDSQKLVIEDAFTSFFEKADKEKANSERPSREVMENLEKERNQKIKLTLSEDKYDAYLKISDQLRPTPPRGQGNQPRQNR